MQSSTTSDSQNGRSTHPNSVVVIEHREESKKRHCTCCDRLKEPCHTFWMPIRTKFNPLPYKASLWQKFKYAFMCPPHGFIGTIIKLVITFAVIFGVLVAVTNEDGLPGGQFFALLVLFIACVLGGYLVSLVKLPPLLGMLIVGCMLRNVPKINISTDISPEWSSALRQVALTVILIKAGLGLDPKALKRMSFAVVRLSFCPCLCETVAIAIGIHFFLDMPWEWAFLLGFVVAAVSPAVVVPSLLGLQDRGFGVNKGIPTLVVAAASIDDVISITGFGVLLGIIFSQGNLAWSIIKGPLEALLGIAYGTVFGVITWYIPSLDSPNLVLYRFILLFGGGMMAVFGATVVELPGAGPLGSLTMAFVSALKWRKQGWTSGKNPVQDTIGVLWMIFQPILFGLIGAEVDISNLKGHTIGMGVASLGISLGVRMLVSFIVVFGAGLNMKEKIFIPIAWMPKATVQAAIGAVALDTVRQTNPDNAAFVLLGEQVLTIAVLVILITAPIGAIGIAISGPLLLHKTPQGKEIEVAAESPSEEHVNKAFQGNDDTGYKVNEMTENHVPEFGDQHFTQIEEKTAL